MTTPATPAPSPAGSVMERREAILAPPDPRRFTTLVRLFSDPKHRVVVSFGGGSVPGLCGNVALARILEELDMKGRVAEVWGTSAGAVIGGGWASGTPASAILDILKSLDRRGAVDICWLRLAGAILLKPFGRTLPDGIVAARHFQDAIRRALAVRSFEECPVPFRCIACTDDGETHRKVFRRGPLFEAIYSSMSLPGIVAPRPRLEGETTGFFDGGLVEKTPLISPIAEHHRRGGGERLVLLGTHFGNDAQKTESKGFINRFLQCIYALEAQAWEYQLKEARAMKDVLPMILNPHVDDPTLFDFSRVELNYLLAREAFLDTLQNARLALTFGML